MKIQDMKLDFNALCRFELLRNKTLKDVIKEEDNISMLDIRALISAGLNISEDKAGDLIQEHMANKENMKVLDIAIEKMQDAGILDKQSENEEEDKKK